MLNKMSTFHEFSKNLDIEETIKKTKQGTDESFYLCNLSDVIRKFDDWINKLPRVKPFYAVSE